MDGKTQAVDIQFLPFNKRTIETISPMIVQSMKVGGTISTDLWKAYLAAAHAAGVEHLTVNHSKGFINPETGVHTNNVEGIHAVMKNMSRKQFNRLPFVTDEGKPYYIDLICWRTNVGLQKADPWTEFCKALKSWTEDPLEDWDHTVPLFDDESPEDEVLGEEEECVGEGEEDEELDLEDVEMWNPDDH